MDDEIPLQRGSHASSSHEASLQPIAKRREDLGKHNVHTHFPKDRNCEICKRTKITRAPCRRRKGEAVPRADNFGDLITADHKVLSDNCESRNNHRYAVVVQDLATQWIQAYPCKKKKTSQETQRSLQKFLEPERKPKVIYTDNSLEFGKACEDLSWNHCTSTPHRSETNGIAERAVRRVQEGASPVLLQSGLNESWWADSMECYTYLRNVTDLLSDGKTPYERRFGKPFWRTYDSIWFIGWVSSYNFEGPVKNPSIWKESFTWIVPRIRSLRGWNLEGMTYWLQTLRSWRRWTHRKYTRKDSMFPVRSRFKNKVLLLRHRSFVPFLLWKSLMPLCTDVFIRIGSLSVKWPRTHLKTQLCNNRSKLYSGYRNKLVNPPMCCHLQWLMLRPVNSYLLSLKPSLLTSNSTLPVWCDLQFSITAVEASASQVVSSLLPFDEVDVPVFNHVHKEQIFAGDTTQKTFENPAVHEQVIVHGIPQVPLVVDSFPHQQEFVAPMCNQVLQEQNVETVQPHVLFQEIPERSRLWIEVSQTTLNTSSTSTSGGVLAATHAATALATTVDDFCPQILEDEKMLGYQAQIDQCVDMLKTRKEVIARYEKQVAALLERVPRAVSSFRHKRALPDPVDECNAFILYERQLVQTFKEKLASLIREMQEKRDHALHNTSSVPRKTEGRTLTSLLSFVENVSQHWVSSIWFITRSAIRLSRTDPCWGDDPEHIWKLCCARTGVCSTNSSGSTALLFFLHGYLSRLVWFPSWSPRVSWTLEWILGLALWSSSHDVIHLLPYMKLWSLPLWS